VKIVFFCPPVSVINGGIKHIFRMAESLIELGLDTVVFEQNGQRPAWIPSTAPVIGQGFFSPEADHLYVLPEDQPHILADFAKFPQRKVIYSQNHFYAARSFGKVRDFSDFGVTDILCSSRTIYEHSRVRHPALRAWVVPCAIDTSVFRPLVPKKKVIAFLPRKRSVEAIFLQDMFRFSYPQYRDWEWLEISNVDEAETARRMGLASVFLSLSRMEGFGLAPLEAMAAGCVVAGFTGLGGREYATSENGFWVQEDDFPACVEALAKAVRLSDDSGLGAYRKACGRTLALYSPETFLDGVKKAWSSIFGI